MSHPESARVLPALPDWLGEGFPVQGSWTYEDYCRIPEDGKRYEVIRGVLHVSPAPETLHQLIHADLFGLFHQFVKSRRLGKVLSSPTDVLLRGLTSPIQPDILFVSRERLHIVKKPHILGAPDLVIEILSPSNTSAEVKMRLDVFAEGGVNECWVVDPETRMIEVHAREGTQFRLLARYGSDDAARSRVLEGLEVPVAGVFSDDLRDE